MRQQIADQIPQNTQERPGDRVFIRIHTHLTQEELAARTGLTVLEVARIQKELQS